LDGYVGVYMTVTELKERMQLLEDQGCGDSRVETWDPNSEGWETITSMVYAKGCPVKLYTDEP
jgi:hypothetical protein